jgi:hypothetical protein
MWGQHGVNRKAFLAENKIDDGLENFLPLKYN